MGYPVNSETGDEGQEDVSSTRKLVPEVENSQVRREKNAHNSDYIGNKWIRWKLGKYTETCTVSVSKSRVPKHEVHEPSINDEDLPFPTKEVGITAGYSTCALGALETNVLIWRMFMSSSMKAAIHLGPKLFGES